LEDQIVFLQTPELMETAREKASWSVLLLNEWAFTNRAAKHGNFRELVTQPPTDRFMLGFVMERDSIMQSV
jgi:hypothetical protein